MSSESKRMKYHIFNGIDSLYIDPILLVKYKTAALQFMPLPAANRNAAASFQHSHNIPLNLHPAITIENTATPFFNIP